MLDLVRKTIEKKFNVKNPNIIALESDKDSDENEILRYSFIHDGVDYSIECYCDGEIDIYDVSENA